MLNLSIIFISSLEISICKILKLLLIFSYFDDIVLIATPFCKAHRKAICGVVQLYFVAREFNSSNSNILPLTTEQYEDKFKFIELANESNRD